MMKVIVVLLCLPGYIMTIVGHIRADPSFTIQEK